MFFKEKCKFCGMPIEAAPDAVRYRKDNGKEVPFCRDECAKAYMSSKGIYMSKVGGFGDKLLGFLDKTNDGLGKMTGFLEGLNDFLK